MSPSREGSDPIAAASALRARVRENLAAVTPKARLESSRAMTEAFFKRFAAPLEKLGRRGIFALYEPMPDEPELGALRDRLEAAGHRVVFPRELPNRSLEFGGPPHGSDPVASGEIDVMVVPGRVFGERGERVGRGRGCYDRYLSRCPRGRPLRVALAFEAQLLPEVPQTPWDQPMDWIVTEKREIQATS